MKKIYTKKELALWHFLKSLFVLMLMVCTGELLKSQVSLYSFASSFGTYNEISGGSVLATATTSASPGNLNSDVYPVTLPFAFNFNGQNYTSLNVSTNGFATFGATAPSTTLTTPISSTTAYDGAISAFGRDLNSVFDISGQNGEIRWETVGTAPNRVVVIQWKNFRPTNVTTNTTVYAFSFQIRLSETSNTVSIVYNGGAYLIGTAEYSSTAQVGLRGLANTDFNNRLNATTVKFVDGTAGTANSSTQAFNTVNDPPGMPSPGFTYTWTPPTCISPGGVNISAVTQSTAVVNWTPSPTPANNGYDVYYSSVNTAPTGTTVLDASNSVSVPSTAVSAPISGLTPGTNYFIWVRAKCSASDQSAWTPASVLFSTSCAPVNTLFENFDSYATGSIVPNCWARIVPAATPGSQSISSSAPFSGTRNMLQTTTAAQTPVVVVLPEFSNINAGTNWLRMKARVSSLPGILEVGYVTNAADAGTFVSLQNLNINNAIYSASIEYTVIVPATVPAGARLAIRTPADGKSYYYDDVYWETIPTCFVPSGVAVSNPTSTSIKISWSAPTVVPTQGYDVYYSTSNIPPTSTTVPQLTQVTSPVTISNLTPLTQYFVWVRSRCSATDQSVWTPEAVIFYTTCQPPAILTATGATVCPNSTATLNATAGTGATIYWYDGSGTELATGPSFTTPSLSATTTYYVGTSVGVSNTPAAKSTYTPSPSSGAGTTNFGLVFDVLSPFMITSVTIYPVSATGLAGTVIIDVIDSNNNILHTVTENVIGSPIATPVPHVVNVGFYMLPGTNYKMRPRSFSGISGLVFDPAANAPGGSYAYPFVVPGVLSINTGTLTAAPTNTPRNDLYYYFYDWKISTRCDSASQPVVATVDSNCLSTVETEKEKLKIYPNPFTDIITISDVRNLKSVTVLDMTGRVVKTIMKPQSKINLSELKTGMYIINIYFEDGSKQAVKAIKK